MTLSWAALVKLLDLPVGDPKVVALAVKRERMVLTYGPRKLITIAFR